MDAGGRRADRAGVDGVTGHDGQHVCRPVALLAGPVLEAETAREPVEWGQEGVAP